MGEREDENVDIEIEVGMERQGSGALSDDKELSSLREPLLILHQTKRTNNTSQLAVVGANVCSIESLDYEYVGECISCIQYIYIYIYIYIYHFFRLSTVGPSSSHVERENKDAFIHT
jgi:hypothetical protein